ncbi:nuclease-related domain-containing protein [Ectobacillus antri]|uniref:Nuclease-related domain-containing protein n=1 Tax=Ectobacillus antri TaxID=2486280 RepID=A0ABT6H8A3_9BACI|nr:nuclease-related domain-containing protein [Ectobacillus antri]MDG4658115.1 nuclease-related domain-containing protein [Ectobacillus antri]MDG5754939.1 nuclease-related domain-containing protein [Ectobacillus antri]
MIQKERRIPLKIKKLEALLRRLPSNHPERSKVETELSKGLTGFQGEQSLNYHLSFLPHYHILHDLRLPASQGYFQIDTLLVSETFLMIVEIKNIAGTLFFDQAQRQLIRTYRDKEEAFPDPLLQATRQQLHLQDWLVRHGFPLVPVCYRVVISNPATLIKTDGRLRNVVHAAALPGEVEGCERMYKQTYLEPKNLRKLCRLLIKQHTPYNPDVLAHLKIGRDEVKGGVYCPSCFALGMKRERGKWTCLKCGTPSKDAHRLSLCDYALLLGSEITNRELRHFLQIESESVATKMLRQMKLESRGERRHRVYKLPLTEWLYPAANEGHKHSADRRESLADRRENSADRREVRPIEYGNRPIEEKFGR